MDDALTVRKKRAAYRAAHRGTKEMDWLMGRYAEAALPAMDGAALDCFERLLAMPDPDLHTMLLDGCAEHPREVADLIGEMRRFHRLEGLAR